MPASAPWCGQCYTPAGPSFPTRPGLPEPSQQRVVRRSRWRKTQTTFGPVGRVLASVALVVPFAFLLATGVIGDPFTLGGAVVWGVVLMPWGLRDVWKAGQIGTG